MCGRRSGYPCRPSRRPHGPLAVSCPRHRLRRGDGRPDAAHLRRLSRAHDDVHQRDAGAARCGSTVGPTLSCREHSYFSGVDSRPHRHRSAATEARPSAMTKLPGVTATIPVWVPRARLVPVSLAPQASAGLADVSRGTAAAGPRRSEPFDGVCDRRRHGRAARVARVFDDSELGARPYLSQFPRRPHGR